MKHRWHDLLDWIDRNADLLPLVALMVVLFAVVATCAGTPDDNTGHLIAAPPSPSGAVTLGSPVSPFHGVEPRVEVAP